MSLSICIMSLPVLLNCWLPGEHLIGTSGEEMHRRELIPCGRWEAQPLNGGSEKSDKDT